MAQWPVPIQRGNEQPPPYHNGNTTHHDGPPSKRAFILTTLLFTYNSFEQRRRPPTPTPTPHGNTSATTSTLPIIGGFPKSTNFYFYMLSLKNGGDNVYNDSPDVILFILIGRLLSPGLTDCFSYSYFVIAYFKCISTTNTSRVAS